MTTDSDFAARLLQETIAASDTEAEGALRAEVFTRLVAARLEVSGTFEDPEAVHYRARGLEVSGYALDDDPKVVHLFATDYRGTGDTESLSNTAIGQAFSRLQNFALRSMDGLAAKLEETSSAYELARLLESRASSLRELRLYLLSDARARDPRFEVDEVPGFDTSYSLWDFERIKRHDLSGEERAPIELDLVAEVESPVECVRGPSSGQQRVLLMVLPGEFIAATYEQFGPKLLERNVRAFLQARGSVNKGIRGTILHEPERFLAYNNGISATASRVELSQDSREVRRISDFQIVNGGQTTATLHHAATRDRADLSQVFVQMKLTVVDEDYIDEIVPFISQYSNSQNRVTGADLSSNDVFYVRLESLSRSVWAPPRDGAQRQTRWFFERARGQFADEVGRQRTTARRRQFRAMNPANQKFTKLDLAKVEHTWLLLPHVVSLGGEKNFKAFLTRAQLAPPPPPDVSYFQVLVGKLITFRTAEKIVSAQTWYGGYRANIVPYALAYLVHASEPSINPSQIWRDQTLSDQAHQQIARAAELVWDVLADPPPSVRNIGEWSKKLDCWKRVEEAALPKG